MEKVKVTYSKKFPYAPYLNEDIGFETMADNEEDALIVAGRLKKMATKFFYDTNPHLTEGDVVPYVDNSQGWDGVDIKPPKLKPAPVAIVADEKVQAEYNVAIENGYEQKAATLRIIYPNLEYTGEQK